MLSVGFPEGKWYDGDEGKWDDGDADINEGDNLHVDEDLSDKFEEYNASGNNDDALFYSSKENEEFECVFDKVVCVINYSDPKHVLHRRRCTTTIFVGPIHPNYEGMTVTEKQFAKDEYERKRKAFTDQKWAKWLKEAALNSETVQSYTGCLHPTLQIMAEVENSRLEVGHTFPDKELLKLRVAEEANRCATHFHVPHSEVRQYKVYSKTAVEANNNEMTNWFM